jgi:hypothetical protein
MHGWLAPRTVIWPCRRDDVRVSDEVVADQIDCYRRRAGEYDVTAYGDVAAARARIARLVAETPPAGNLLEIACGTGLWMEALAGSAETVKAIDAAPEAVAIARDRVRSASVSFEVADVFSWDSGTQFDVIFFSAWLSHVPTSRFRQFWRLGDHAVNAPVARYRGLISRLAVARLAARLRKPTARWKTRLTLFPASHCS